jgi:hypothetical protein
MAINKEAVIRLFEQLPETAQQSALDYLQFLSKQHSRLDWNDIAKLDPDDEPLSDEETKQLDSKLGFMSWEEAMNELDLPTDTKS